MNTDEVVPQRGAVGRARGARPRFRSRPRRRPRRGNCSQRRGRAATTASSPGTISTVAIATPPLATAGCADARRDRAVEPHGLGIDEPAVAPHAPAIDQRACCTVSPMPVRPNTMPRPGTAAHPSASVDLDARDEPRAIEQDGLLRQPGERRAGGDVELHVDRRVRPERAIDLLGRRRGDDQARILAGRDVEREAVAAGHAAGGVDQHGFELGRRRARTAHAQRAASCSRPRRRLAGDVLDRERERRRPRGWRRRSHRSSPPPCARPPREKLDRHRALQRSLVQVGAVRRIDHRAAIHHHETGRRAPARNRDTARPARSRSARDCADRRSRGRYP